MTVSVCIFQEVIEITADEIIALVSAGYNKADIEAMTAAPATDPQPAPVTDPQPAPAADPQPAPAADPQPAPAADPQSASDDRIAALEQAIGKLTQTIQASNILKSGSGGAPELTGAEALASLITKNKKE